MKTAPNTSHGAKGGWLLLLSGLSAAALLLGWVGWRINRAAGDELAARRELVARLSAAEKADLQRRQQRLAALDHAERARIQLLHERFQSDPDVKQLQAVLTNYHAWLASLHPRQRAELAEMEPQPRLRRIRGLLAEQARWQGLSRADLTVLMRALEPHVQRQEKPSLQSLPPVQRAQMEQHLQRLSPAQRSRALLALFLIRTQWDTAVQLPPLSAAALDELRPQFSRELQQRLESKTPQEQWAILLAGLRQSTREASGRELLFAVDEQELGRFFEEDLTREQRDSLLGLPADEMLRELRRMYWMSLKLGDGMFHRPEYPGGRPGHSEPGKTRSKRGPGELFPRLPGLPFAPGEDKGRRGAPSGPAEPPPASEEKPKAGGAALR